MNRSPVGQAVGRSFRTPPSLPPPRPGSRSFVLAALRAVVVMGRRLGAVRRTRLRSSPRPMTATRWPCS